MELSSKARTEVFAVRMSAKMRQHLKRMMERDKITGADFIERAILAYELMYPGPDYQPPEHRAS